MFLYYPNLLVSLQQLIKIYDVRIINKHILGKLIRKNRGNVKLIKSIEQLVFDIENNIGKHPEN
jgi:hypothetical protein